MLEPGGDDVETARRALDYPYERHESAFWLDDGAVQPDPDPLLARRNRIPVLAYGSNAAPEQLARKFSGRSCGAGLYVEPVTLDGWEVVYAARLTRYGAIPARIVTDTDCSASVHLTWLSEDQAAWMDRTEGAHYTRGALPFGAVKDCDDRPIDGVVGYLDGGSPLVVDGSNAALAAIATAGRSLPAYHTNVLLQRAAGGIGHEGALHEFALRLVRDVGFAETIAALLRRGL